MKRPSLLVLSVLQLVIVVTSQIPSPYEPLSNYITDLPQRLDTHSHYVPPFYRDLLASRKVTAGGFPTPNWDVDSHLAFNAEYGIVTSFISVTTPGAKLTADAPVEEGRTLARQINEYGYNLTKEYPKRFLLFATLTLPDLEGAVAEAIYALDTLGAAGIAIEASAYGELLGTPRYAPLYKVLNDRKAVVFVHPSKSVCAEQPEFSADSTDIPPYVADFLLDTSRAALNLVYRNVTTDYPDITFILAHSGGFIPFAAVRATVALGLIPGSPAGAASAYYERLKHFHVDVAISASNDALVSTTAFFNNTRLVFGSDYPYASAGWIRLNTDSLQAYPNLDHNARREIDYGNTYKLLEKFLILED